MSEAERELQVEAEAQDDEPQEPVDQLGIPMSREPTIDDVRGDGVAHRRLAVGCTLLVAALLAAFYVIRAVAFG